MSFGITNSTVTNMTELTSIANVTDMPNLLININNTVYNGYLYFVMLWVLLIILYFAAQNFKDQPIINLMYSSAVVSILSFFLRAVNVVKEGVIVGLLSDFQMWIFPLITMSLVAIIWALKK